MEIKVHKYDNDDNNYYCKNSKKKTYTEKPTKNKKKPNQWSQLKW